MKGGNLFDDHPFEVLTLDNSAIENIAVSTPAISPDSVSNAEMSISCEKCEYQCASETLMTLHMKKHKGKNN